MWIRTGYVQGLDGPARGCCSCSFLETPRTRCIPDPAASCARRFEEAFRPFRLADRFRWHLKLYRRINTVAYCRRYKCGATFGAVQLTTRGAEMKARQSRTRPKATKVSARRGGHKVIVEFPAALYTETERATIQLSINRSTLIRSAVQEYLDRWRRKELEKELAEGYVANAAQARETAQAFSHVDSELP